MASPANAVASDCRKTDSRHVADIQIMSDLHLETPRYMPMYSEFSPEARSSHLALLGDIGGVNDDRLFEFIERQLKQFAIVFYVLGNHEPYDGTYAAALSKLEAFEATVVNRRRADINAEGASSLGEFVFLNRRRFDLFDNVTILGCTLFSSIPDSHKSTVSLFVSDFSNIHDWSVDSHNAAHRADLAWLNEQVEAISRDEPERVITIITHYSPTKSSEANDPEHLEDSRGILCAFVTDLEREHCWANPAVKLWAFGHTHYNCDFVETNTNKRIISNQRGYGREDIFDFDAEKVVSLTGIHDATGTAENQDSAL